MEPEIGTALVEIRCLGPLDIETVVAIERSSPEASQWSWADYERVARGELHGWVAEDAGKVVGFLVARAAADEMEVLNLAVHPMARRAGVGSRLLEQAFAMARRMGARRAFLEVRESNARAIAFYHRQGFAVTARRPRYYSDPVEDALVLSRQLDGGLF